MCDNAVTADNRIPPYGMSYDEARRRNALPVPATQFGDPGPGGVYDHYDDVPLNPPAGATYGTIELLYQPTSWEYIQFLYLANTGTVPFLGAEGANLLEAWLNTGMAEPQVMASVSWGAPPGCVPDETPELTCSDGADNDCNGDIDCGDSACFDHPDCTGPACDGDATCDLGESCETCATDCDGVTSGRPANRYCCGNGVTEDAESADPSLCDGNF